MPRAIWSGSVSFGMVSFPLRLHAAVREQDVRLHNVHRNCGSRVNAPLTCRTCDREVEQAELVKAYEVSKDELVWLEGEELEAIGPASTRSLQVTAFVPLAEVPAVLIDKTYYAGPDEKLAAGHKAFALFRDALARSGKAAVAKVALRSRESVCLIRPMGKALGLTLLHWPDEVVAIGEVEDVVGEVEISAEEAAVADQLIAALSRPASVIGEAKDEYRAGLSALIDNKLSGGSVSVSPAGERTAGPAPVDLVAALRASIAVVKPRKQRARKTDAVVAAVA